MQVNKLNDVMAKGTDVLKIVLSYVLYDYIQCKESKFNLYLFKTSFLFNISLFSRCSISEKLRLRKLGLWKVQPACQFQGNGWWTLPSNRV